MNVQDPNPKTVEEPPQRETPETTDSKKRGEKRKAESGKWFCFAKPGCKKEIGKCVNTFYILEDYTSIEGT